MTQESPSHGSSKSNSVNSLSHMYLVNSMLKSFEWLNELREIHYVPYNSCNSLTIYSYKYWINENKFLVATKANNLKVRLRTQKNKMNNEFCTKALYLKIIF